MTDKQRAASSGSPHDDQSSDLEIIMRVGGELYNDV